MSGGLGHRLTRRTVLSAGTAFVWDCAVRTVAAASTPALARIEAVRPGGRLRLGTASEDASPQDQWRWLSGLDFPKPPARESFRARQELSAWLLGQDLLVQPEARLDEVSLWLLGEGDERLGASVQRECLARGLARLRPGREGWPHREAELQAAYAAEDLARERKRGLWASPEFAVRDARDADALAQDVESWQIVRGVVTGARRRSGVSFLNFGSDWRTDVTVVVPDRVSEGMAEAPETLAGARVEARGFVELVNGPSLWLRDARSLRVLA